MASNVYVDMLLPTDVYPGCDNCQHARELIFNEARILAIIGGVFGSFGAWFVISGYREKAQIDKLKAKNK